MGGGFWKIHKLFSKEVDEFGQFEVVLRIVVIYAGVVNAEMPFVSKLRHLDDRSFWQEVLGEKSEFGWLFDRALFQSIDEVFKVVVVELGFFCFKPVFLEAEAAVVLVVSQSLESSSLSIFAARFALSLNTFISASFKFR